MTWRRIFFDDFASYASDSDVAAAYPDPGGGSAYDTAATDWGSTYGPDGQPGIKDQVTSPARDTGALTKYLKPAGLSPAGRAFRVIGRWNDAATNHILTAHDFFILFYQDDAAGIFGSSSIQLNRIHSSQSLSIVIKTIAPYGNASGGTRQLDTLVGVLTTNVPKTFEINGHLSTKTETSPGVFEPNNDGDVHILIDDVEIYSWSGPIWDFDDSLNLTPPWNVVAVTTIGAFTNFDIYDEPVGVSPAVLINNSAKCCTGAGVEGNGAPAPGAGVEKGGQVDPTWSSRVEGGGEVPSHPDLTDPEGW